MSSTKKEMASGVFYTSIAKYSNIIVQIVVTAILSRLLTPEDYGIVAVATVFIIFFNILSDIGIGPAVIQFKDLSRKDVNTIYTLTVYLGISLSFLFFCSSWIISNYYESNELLSVCQLLSLTILFNCLNIVPQNLQYQKKHFRYVAVCTLVVSVLTAIVGVILALFNFGVYALVFQNIINSFAIFCLFFRKERLSFLAKIDINPLKRIYSFSVYQFLFNIVNYFSRNLDKLLIGRYVGLSALGQYEKSYRLMTLPLQNITFVITPVLQPIFSGFQDDLYEMAEKYRKLFQFLCLIGFPLSIMLFFISKELILLFYGEQWHDAIFPFKIMSLTVGLQILNGTTGSMYQSANATKKLFQVGCITAMIMVGSFFIAILGWNTIGSVAIAFSIGQLLNSIQVYYFLFDTLHYPLKKIFDVMYYPICISGLLAIVLYFTNSCCELLPIINTFCIKIAVGVFTWIVLVNISGPYKGSLKVIFIKLKKTYYERKNNMD